MHHRRFRNRWGTKIITQKEGHRERVIIPTFQVLKSKKKRWGDDCLIRLTRQRRKREEAKLHGERGGGG